MSLRDLVINSAQRWPDNIAIQSPDECMTYQELDHLANRFARMLDKLGVCPGDRIGIWLEKSARAIVVMQAALRLNAAYVPLDPLSPAARIRTILDDCKVRVLVTTRQRLAVLTREGASAPNTVCFCLDGVEAEHGWNSLAAFSDEPLSGPPATDDVLAYILYTSGSTGIPKGVCISNRNALAFVEWAVEILQAVPSDRFANHAPFHFDLSVLDLYGAFSVGAAVLLIPEGISYLPKRLVDFVLGEAPTIWYSVPSVLTLMMEQGGFLNIASHTLRAILFAGEPFPIKYLRFLHEAWPTVRLLNLYGPTETNVCTFYEVKKIEQDRMIPVPIGRACSGDQVWAEKEDGTRALPGEEGELMVGGPTVMLGYWGLSEHGNKPYRTGDLVRLQEDGNYVFIGRRDHMVKVRGYRIELGDIEAALLAHPSIQEAAVLAAGEGIETHLIAFIVCCGQEVPSLLEIKRHCAEHLPRYMIVDAIRSVTRLPRTRNGKIDRLALSNEVTR